MVKLDRPTPRVGRPFIVPALAWSVAIALVAVQGFFIFGVEWRGVPAAFQPNGSSVAGLVAILAMCSVGGLIAARHPTNRIGWLLVAIAVTASFLDIPRLYAGVAIYVHPGLPGAVWLYWLSQLIWILVFIELLVLLPLWFPDGRLLSRRWSIVIGLATVPLMLVIIGSLDPSATAPLRNPIGVRALAGVNNTLNSSPIFTVLTLATFALGISALVVRYRRGDEQQRQQLKWLLVGVVLLLAALVCQILVPALQNSPLIALAAACLPVAIGIAVLRYRLYDIDLIINKALVYGGLAAVITAVYVLIVINIGALVGGSQRLWLSLLTTAVIALVFQPLRDRAQRLANRLVYGRRATPYEALSQFSEHLSETYSEEDMLDRMTRILAQGTGAQRAEAWVRAGQRLILASSSPPIAEPVTPLTMKNGSLPEMQRDIVVPVSHGGELLGALAVDKKRGESLNAVEQKLVANLAGQAGLVLKNVGLNRELLARLDDLRASRQRLVTAQDEERRRIERNLHDGAQQHLVALKIKVGLAEGVAEPESKTRPILAQLKHDADEAIDNLRELARGIYPPLLASDGLGPALHAHARRLTVPVELEVDGVPRQPREVESAIYFCCLEALQNVAKYAEAGRVKLRVWRQDATLAFAVEDNGKGFEPATVVGSSGLQNMRDRLEALGGSLQVRSAPAEGTTVEGRVPLRPEPGGGPTRAPT